MTETPHYLHLPPGSPLPDIGHLSPFRALVIIEAQVESGWQGKVSDWLVQSGCLYMMAWGHDCTTWDDSVDIANLEAFDYGDIPDECDVFTTWHADESLGEVFDFCKRHARHPVVDLPRVVLVHVALHSDATCMIEAYAAA
ncbi:DUF7684 family protein [Lysobacter brunescens]|uniref:DUF7684 domain-containing protein n=1 Tax=Lysobacter brunescens TaxID=262323 RepID=A0ABW2YH94_9GAMM